MIYNFRNDKIILAGDTHSTETLYEILNTRVPNGSDFCHVGDGGWGFGESKLALENAEKMLYYMNVLCKKIDVNCYLIIGNHDNPRVFKLPNLSNVFLTKTGDVGIFPNGKKVLFVGGGISVDRCRRIQDIDYWKDEITPYLENVPSCDILFSHDTADHFNHPTSTLPLFFKSCVDRDPKLMDEALIQRMRMNDIIEMSGIKTQFYGHFHQSLREEKFGVYAQCLDINEVFEFDSTAEYKL